MILLQSSPVFEDHFEESFEEVARKVLKSFF